MAESDDDVFLKDTDSLKDMSQQRYFMRHFLPERKRPVMVYSTSVQNPAEVLWL